LDVDLISKNFSLTFLIDLGKSLWYGNHNEKIDLTSKQLKSTIKENSLFKINSEVINIQTNKQERISSLDCFYSPAQEALCLIIEEDVKINHLSKEIISNIMDFATKASAKQLILLLDRKNKDYVKIMQSMMMVGFGNDTRHKTAKLECKEYKLMKMDCKSVEIEEITF